MKLTGRARLLFLILVLEASVAAAIWSGTYREDVLKALRRTTFRWRRQKAIMAARPVDPTTYAEVMRLAFDDESALEQWEEKIFKGRTDYKVASEEGRSYLSCSSEAASSGLFKKMDLPVSRDLFLSWRWRAHEFPKKKKPGELANRSQDDFAARVYVVFPGTTFFNTRVIEYIWDETIESGRLQSSPFSGNVKLFVIESGAGRGWRDANRNLYEDYQKIFGRPPDRRIGAIALMSDSDNTGTVTRADFGDIILKVKSDAKEAVR